VLETLKYFVKRAELSGELLAGGGTLWVLIKNALISLINNCKQRFMQTISFIVH